MTTNTAATCKQIAWGGFLFVSLLIGTALADDTLNQQLLTAVKAGDKGKVEELIARGVDLRAKENVNILGWAVSTGNKDVVDLLIAKGADVNGKDTGGHTPLNAAVGWARVDIVDLLIAKGADVSGKDADGNTPLYIAVWGRARADIAKRLLAKGADVNGKGQNGYTPLRLAVRNDYKTAKEIKEIADVLFANGADVNAGSRVGGDTPLIEAIHANSKEWAELLISKGANLNAIDNYGNTPLLEALARPYYHEDLTRLLITNGANPNLGGNRTTPSPFETAIIEGNKSMVELMLANGADASSKDRYDRTMPSLAELNPNMDANTKQAIVGMLQAAIVQNRAQRAGNDIATLLAQYKGHIDDDILRRSIIVLAMKQHPSIPPEAEAAAGRGTYIFKNANSMGDKLSAAKQYLTAIELAPWMANYYYNLCTVLEKTPYTAQALHACKLYLVAAPNAVDAGDMQQRVAGLQYAVDQDKAQMKQRTAYTGHNRQIGREELYRFGGISGEVSGKDIVLKLFVDWDSAPPKYQIYAGCLGSDDTDGAAHDLVSTDEWLRLCSSAVSMHLVIKPEGEGFVQVSAASGDNVRVTIEELFKAKQKTMAQALILSSFRGEGEQFYIPYVQGGTHSGYLMYESDCNGSVLKKDPRALPDHFLPSEKSPTEGGFLPNLDLYGKPKTDICTSEFSDKTGYKFGEME